MRKVMFVCEGCWKEVASTSEPELKRWWRVTIFDKAFDVCSPDCCKVLMDNIVAKGHKKSFHLYAGCKEELE